MSQLVEHTLADVLSHIVDNRGRSCPTVDAGFPLIATNCVKDDELYPVFENVRYIDEETRHSWFRGHPQPGDLLFVCKGDPGRVALVPDPVTFCIAQDMLALRASPEVVDPRYLYYVLKSRKVREKIVNLHVGTMIPHFKKGDFDKLKFLIHEDLHEQRAIAAVLGALDDKIASNTKLAVLLDAHMAHEYTAATMISGKTVQLVDVAVFHNRRRIPLSSRERDDRPGNVPYYGASGVFGRVDEPIFNEPLVLVGEDGSVIKADGTPVIQYIWGPSWVNNHAHVLTGAGISTELLYHAIAREQVTTLVTGAVQPKINMGNLKRLELHIPVSDALHAIEGIVGAETASKRSLVEENRTLAATRDVLLPALMSGKLRVNDAEKVLEGVL